MVCPLCPNGGGAMVGMAVSALGRPVQLHPRLNSMPKSRQASSGCRSSPAATALLAQNWPHNWATYGVARAAKTRDSTAVGRRSMVRMGPVLRVTQGPSQGQIKLRSYAGAASSAVGGGGSPSGSRMTAYSDDPGVVRRTSNGQDGSGGRPSNKDIISAAPAPVGSVSRRSWIRSSPLKRRAHRATSSNMSGASSDANAIAANQAMGVLGAASADATNHSTDRSPAW
jgi:hypothetical protein